MIDRIAARVLCLQLALLCAPGCRGSSIAELASIEQRVERDFARAVGSWSGAEPGARFAMGDGLRTGPQASARLTLSRGGKLLVKSDTSLRFLRSLPEEPNAQGIEVTTGELTVETGEIDVGVRTPRGVVKLAAQSVVKVRAQSDKVRFDVAVGRAEHASPTAAQRALAGGGFELDVLPVAVEKPAAQPLAAGEAAAAPVPAPLSPSQEELGPWLRALQFQEAPAQVSVALAAGESATIHDPSPPSDVRLTSTRCPGQAVLELDLGNGRFDVLRVRGNADLRARVPAGNYRYRVRCIRGGRLETTPVSSGRLSVVRDAAVRPLPRKPVSITADADGRNYTVSYQNRLPAITLRWPEAPKAPVYTLRVQPEHEPAFEVRAKQPSVTLAAGRLGEGQHRFEFSCEGARSEQGLLGVTFDYRARTAYLTSPVEGHARTTASSARFAGGTLIGSTVSIQGSAVKLDAQGRFAAEVPLPSDGAGLALRVMHPSTGIHYYVRHLSNAP